MTLGHARNTAIPVTSSRTGFRALSLKEPLVDDHDNSGSRAESETTMDDVTRHQCDSEVCVLELYSEDDDTLR